MSNEQTVMIGEQALRFNVPVDEVNRYFDEMLPNSKVQPGWNLLVRTVHADDKAAMRELLTIDGQPNGMQVAAVVGLLVQEFSSAAQVTIKKPSATPAPSSKTD